MLIVPTTVVRQTPRQHKAPLGAPPVPNTLQVVKEGTPNAPSASHQTVSVTRPTSFAFLDFLC